MAKTTDEYRHRICRAMDFITANLAESPSVAEIARAAPFSQFHFQRLFKSVVGESVAEFTRRVRLETAARHLLFRPKDEITEVAFGLGFSSSQNFAKAFRKHFDVSPSEYRQGNADGVFPGDSENSTNGNMDRTDGNADPDDRSYDHSSVLTNWKAKQSVPQPDVTVRKLETTKVVYRRHFGSYDDPAVHAAFDELSRWAKVRSLPEDGRYLGIPWDELAVTNTEKCRFDACLVVDRQTHLGPEATAQEIPGGKYAVYACEVVNNDFERPWIELMRDWLPQSGWQPADQHRFERYLSDGSDDPEGRWQLEVCLPVIPL